MNRKLLTGCAALLIWHAVAAQDSLKVWTLQTCLDYALENNIQLQQSRNDYLSGLEDTREAKAALLPSLAVSATQGYTNYPSSNAEDNNSYTGTYGINAGLTLYEGGKLRTAVKEQSSKTASTHSRSPNPRTTSASPSSKPTCRRSTPPKPWR